MKETAMLGIDQSTSGTKIIAVDRNGNVVYKDSKKHHQYYPVNGLVEQDMDEIYNNICVLINGAIDNLSAQYELLGLSITNQRETIVAWDKNTRKPCHNAIVWQDRRGTQICQNLLDKGYGSISKRKTGLPLDPYFSASKMKWLLENIPMIMELAYNEQLAIGTVDSYIIYRLTKGHVFATDDTNASRTLLYNIDSGKWDEDLLDMYGIPISCLAEIKSSNGDFGITSTSEIDAQLPIRGVIGDSQGALFGQLCYKKGTAKVTYGTGSSIMIYTGKRIDTGDSGIVSSVAWSIDGKTGYAIEGMINCSGDTINWLRENLGIINAEDSIESMIEKIDSNEGVYIIPAFQGLGAPYWNPKARASIIGMTRRSNKNHVVRAAVESMAYQVADLIFLMEEIAGAQINCVFADGGPSSNNFLMQLQANIINKDILCSINQELSVLGAVYIGGIALGMWENVKTVEDMNERGRRYYAKQEACHRDWYNGWKMAIGNCIRY